MVRGDRREKSRLLRTKRRRNPGSSHAMVALTCGAVSDRLGQTSCIQIAAWILPMFAARPERLSVDATISLLSIWKIICF